MSTVSTTTSSETPFAMNGVPAAATPSGPQPAAVRTAKIMIVDDEPVNIKVAQQYLRLEGYRNFITTTESREAVDVLQRESPDLLLLDLMMPHVSGLDILEQVRSNPAWTHLPVVILTAASDQATKRKALSLGANDFLGKPIDPAELIPRIHNVLTVKRQYDCLQEYSKGLENDVLRRTAEINRSRQEVTYCLARACEYRDGDASRHVLRVGRYTRLIAKAMGWKGDRLDVLEQAAQLHDIGKIGVPDAVLQNASKLSPEDFAIIAKHCSEAPIRMKPLVDNELVAFREHTRLGAQLLKGTHSPILTLAAAISLSHHERWDGTGYPLGLAGEDIPIEGRMTAVADKFDTLASPRAYKNAFSLDKCFAILNEDRGAAFDPKVLDAFFRCRQEILYTQLQHSQEGEPMVDVDSSEEG